MQKTIKVKFVRSHRYMLVCQETGQPRFMAYRDVLGLLKPDVAVEVYGDPAGDYRLSPVYCISSEEMV